MFTGILYDVVLKLPIVCNRYKGVL